jgi:hypothetical protein
MKYTIILLLGVILISCQTFNQEQREYCQTRNRTYHMTYDSVVKKIVEFSAYSKTRTKIIAAVPGLVLIEESLNDEQIYRYTDYNQEKYNSSMQGCQERLLINIKPDSSTTAVDIKSIIRCSISYLDRIGKSSKTVNKDMECNSTGIREKEILDFLGN